MKKFFTNNQEKPEILPINGVKKVIAIASAKGGVGKSTISTNIAVSLSKQNYKVGLVDADIYGPSIAHMMNLSQKPEIENNLMIPINSYGVDCISIGSLIDKEKAAIWRGPMITKTLYQLIRGVKWDNIDYLIIDFPPGTGDIHLSMAQKFPIDGAIIVSTPQEISVIDTIKSIDMFLKLNIPILGMIQNMSYLKNQDGSKSFIFGEDGAKKMAKKMGIKFLGDILLDTKIREASDNKNPAVNIHDDIAKIYDGIISTIL